MSTIDAGLGHAGSTPVGGTQRALKDSQGELRYEAVL